tara:strand:+ start:78 stop:716 length:639 start_codon:yes stop_codon:yes gene_type:complete
MSQFNIFNKSFKFDNNAPKKVVHILRQKALYFNILPECIIREIFGFISGKKKGYYYYIQDNSIYPKKINKYLGKITEKQINRVKVSYNGWNRNFDEWVSLKHITYLRDSQYPLYFPGMLLEFCDISIGNKWYLSIITNVTNRDNNTFIDILYTCGIIKKNIIVKNIPIYYKYITAFLLHTSSFTQAAKLRRTYRLYNSQNPTIKIDRILDLI